MRRRIAQIGTFDVENFGDLLFPDVLKIKLGDCFDIDLFSPTGGIKCFDTVPVFPMSTFEEKCKENKYSAVIIGGGDLLRTDGTILLGENEYNKGNISSLELWVFPILIAKKYGIPVLLNAPGVTNNFNETESSLIKKVLEYVDYLNVRDTESLSSLQSIGVSNAIIVPDTINVISSIYSPQDLDVVYNKLKNEKIIDLDEDEYYVFQHNSRMIDNPKYYSKLIEAIAHISQNNKVLFMPIGYVHSDMDVLEKLYSENIPNTFIINNKRKLSPIEMISILEHSKGYIGTSMHGAIVSNSYNKPILILNSMNSKKLHGFANITNNTKLDSTNIEDVMYIYDNYFEKKSPKNEKIFNVIDLHFEKMRNIIENIKSEKIDTSEIIDLIKQHYIQNYKMCCMFANGNDYLNRKIFEYKYLTSNELEITVTDEFKNSNFYPVINNHFFAEKIYVNEKLLLENSYLSKNKKFVLSNARKIKLEGHICSDDEWYYYIGNIIDSFNEMKEKLTNTEVALKQAEMYYDAYKQNIEKYIENE